MPSKATPQGTLSYTYDKTGNVASVLSSNANGTNVSYAWDADNRLLNVNDNGTTGVTSYTYDATNPMASMLLPNGVTHGLEFYNRDRTTSLNVTGPSRVLASYSELQLQRA